MMMIVYSVAMGVSIGAMALVARRVGEKNLDAAALGAVQGVALGAVIALVVGLVGAIFAASLLRTMGADAQVVAAGSRFARVMLGGNATVFLLFVINAFALGPWATGMSVSMSIVDVSVLKSTGPDIAKIVNTLKPNPEA